MSYWLSVVLIWLPKIFFGIIFILAVLIYGLRKSIGLTKSRTLIISSISFHVLYAVLLTISQYYIWSQNKFTQLLLNSSLDLSMPVSGYFLFYSFGRFWLNALITIGAAFVFYLFLKFLKKHRERFFEEGETELGFLSALIVGWPNFVVFLPLVFVFVVLLSIFRRVFLKEFYTTMGIPFLLAALIVLIFGNQIVDILSLGVLRI